MADQDDEILELSGQRLRLKRHPTDLAVVGESAVLAAAGPQQTRLTAAITRLQAASPEERDRLLAEARRDSVAQPVYQVEGTGEEILVGDRLEVELGTGDPEAIEAIARDFHLRVEGRFGEAYLLRLTPQTGAGAVEVAQAIARRPEVSSCRPQILSEHQRHGGSHFQR